jgi:hypothetical protein
VELIVPAKKTKSVPRDHSMSDTAVSVGTCMGNE